MPGITQNNSAVVLAMSYDASDGLIDSTRRLQTIPVLTTQALQTTSRTYTIISHKYRSIDLWQPRAGLNAHSSFTHTRLLHYTRLMASFPWQPGVSWYQKGKTSLDLNEARDDGVLGMAVASAGPYANNLHVARDR